MSQRAVLNRDKVDIELVLIRGELAGHSITLANSIGGEASSPFSIFEAASWGYMEPAVNITGSAMLSGKTLMMGPAVDICGTLPGRQARNRFPIAPVSRADDLG
jgi:hypothetical protein